MAHTDTGTAQPAAALRGLIDSVPEGLLALDGAGTITEANAAAASILGRAQADLIGTPLAATVAPADRSRLRAAVADVTREPHTLELRLSDDPEPWSVTLRVLSGIVPRTLAGTFSRDGAAPRELRLERLERFALRFPFAVIAFRHDRRIAFANGRARALLGRDAVRVGARVGEDRTAELLPYAERLTQVPEPLQTAFVEAADGRVLRVAGLAATDDDPAVLFLEDSTEQLRQERVMREFLRNAAHQLRTPLAGITAAVETLQSGAKERPDDRDRFLAHLETHAERLTRIARGLLTLARVQSGEQLNVDFVELQPLAERLVQGVAPQDGVVVRMDVAAGLAVLAHPELLQETLAVLLDNAVAHTETGEIRLAAQPDGDRLSITVTDSGTGIPSEFRDRVFEPFFRLAPDGEGYGLGLAIAAQAVVAMRGEIDVSGAPDGGTIFTVRLPAAARAR